MKAALPFLALVACQSAEAPSDSRPDCQVTVSFGSYAMGIDRQAASEIETLLAGSPDVRSVSRFGGGREGEYALCVQAQNKAAALRVVERIAPLLPSKPRGPISVQGPGRRLEAPTR